MAYAGKSLFVGNRNSNGQFPLIKTLTFSATGIREHHQDNTTNECVLMDQRGPTSDHYYLGSVSTIEPDETSRVRKRLNLENLDENYSSKRTRKSNQCTINRCDTSLTQLTRKFADLITKANTGKLNLNSICRELAVSKRRLYDITNVLEGIGLLDKPSRNFIQWKGNDNDTQVKKLESDIHNLEMKENMLDEIIQSAEMTLASFREQINDYTYISGEDLKSIDILKNKTSIGIHADQTTKLGLYDVFKLHIKSDSKPITGYLLDENGLITLGSKVSNEDLVRISNNKVCSQANSLLKKALISEEDDLLSLGKSILLQTEDQLNESSPFDTFEIDYNFMLDHEEGLSDLFDSYDLSTL